MIGICSYNHRKFLIFYGLKAVNQLFLLGMEVFLFTFIAGRSKVGRNQEIIFVCYDPSSVLINIEVYLVLLL